MDVSVIIVNWNTRDILSNCLASIYSNTELEKFEVIVVDNGSVDKSVNMVREKFPQVYLIENKENRGFAAANNQGIRKAKGRYVLVLNSDTEVLDDAIAQTVKFADTHPEAAVVGCRVLNPDKTLQPTCFMFPSVLNLFLAATYLYKIFPKSKFFGRERMSWWDRSDEREIDVVTGCFMLVRKEAIERVGLMDESFFMYGEETDWCYRLKNSGHKIMFTPSTEIIHYGGASSTQRSPEMRLQLSASILLFMLKHRSKCAYCLACLLTTLFFLMRIPYWLAIYILVRDMKNPALKTVRTYFSGVVRSLLGWNGLVFREKNA